MFHLHCWHLVPGSERKIRVPTRCQSSKPEYVRDVTITLSGFEYVSYIQCQVIEQCCICHKTRKQKRNYSEPTGSRFKDIKEG